MTGGPSMRQEFLAGLTAVLPGKKGPRRPTPTAPAHDGAAAPVGDETRVAILSTGRQQPAAPAPPAWWTFAWLPPDVAALWCFAMAALVATVALAWLPWPAGVLRGLAVAAVAATVGFGLLRAAGVTLWRRSPAQPPVQGTRR